MEMGESVKINPADKPADPGSGNHDRDLDTNSRSTVLVVDDEKCIRLTCEAFLIAAGHEVLLAADAAEAEAHFANQDIDVAVVDILLGRDNGLAVAQRLFECRPNTQVVFATSEPGFGSARAAIQLHAFDYLSKPVTKAQLLEVVGRAVAEKVRRDRYDTLQKEDRQHRQQLEKMVSERTRTLAGPAAHRPHIADPS